LEPVTRLADLADRIVAAGVRRVAGRVVTDDARHDSVRYLSHWKPDYFLDGDIGRLSALTVDDANASFPGESRVEDPAAHAGAELVRLLAARGVVVDGGSIRGRAPDDAVELARVESSPLADIVEAMITSSDNQTAELLLREMGAAAGDGSTARGATAAVHALEGLGVPLAGARIVDGSGLGRENALSCATLVEVLGLRTRDDFAALDRGLAVAGRTGTLAQRLSDPAIADRLRAKTGYLEGVSGLVGVVDGPSPIEFATLVAGDFGEERSRGVQAAVATVVAGFPSVPTDLVPAP
jgi:D-alanyl-D-alanine carboxypeptidase/D-alanyl-D-alanine-endopeptidase (penicillin-binding protein 4)